MFCFKLNKKYLQLQKTNIILFVILRPEANVSVAPAVTTPLV
jgi:hypothetical protein